MSSSERKTEEELIETISQNIKYPPDYLRGMTSSLPLEELAVISKKDRRNIYTLQLPIFFGTAATPFGLLILGAMKPKNTTYKFIGFSLLGLFLGKLVSLGTLHTEATKQFPNGTVANLGKGTFMANIILRGKNLYGEGWTEPKKPETLET